MQGLTEASRDRPAPRIGFVLAHEQFPASELVELGAAAERAGFDAVWTSDHFHPWQDNQGHAGQAWITLAALGQRTRSIPFGTGVTCPTYRYRPAIVAQAFATLAGLYPGRVFLGLGAGEALNEVPAGGGWDDYKTRAARLEAAVGLIRRLWTGEWVSSSDETFSVRNARLYDPPPRPIPIYIAGSGPKSAGMAGRCGDGWIVDGETLRKRQSVEAFRRDARSAGKDPSALRILVEQYVVVGGEREAMEAADAWRFVPIGLKELLDEPDPRAIQRAAEERLSLEEVYSRWPVSDDPDVHAQQIREVLRAGATDVFVHSGQRDQRKVIEIYGREVLPRLRAQGREVDRAA